MRTIKQDDLEHYTRGDENPPHESSSRMANILANLHFEAIHSPKYTTPMVPSYIIVSSAMEGSVQAAAI